MGHTEVKLIYPYIDRKAILKEKSFLNMHTIACNFILELKPLLNKVFNDYAKQNIYMFTCFTSIE